MDKRIISCVCLTSLTALIILAGCTMSPLKQDPKTLSATDGLDRIEAIQLEDVSSEAPVSVEQASEEVATQMADPNSATAPIMELSLEQVRAATLAHNLDLKIDLIDPSLAQRTVDIERAKFEGVFFASATYHTNETETEAASVSHGYEAGIEVPLATGGSVTVGMPFGHTDTDDPDGVADTSLSVSYVQSLLRGAGTSVNTHSIRIAEYQKGMVDARTKQAMIRLLADADIAYWLLYAACRELDVRREQYDLAQDQLYQAQRQVAAGAVGRIETVRAEAGLAARIEAVINAETMVESRQRWLRRIMNRPDLPLNSDIQIVPTSEPYPLGLKIDQEEMAETALANRMETIQWELQLAVDELDVKLARNATLPDLNLRYNYSTTAQDEDFRGAFAGLRDDPFDSHSVGLYATIPLGNRAAKARLQRQRLQQLQDRASYERQRQFIREDVYEAINELEKNWRRILAAEQGVVAANRDFDVERSQFQLGLRDSTAVLYSATGLADAKLRRIAAFTGYEIAQINLARATGTLLGHDRILIPPIDLPD